MGESDPDGIPFKRSLIVNSGQPNAWDNGLLAGDGDEASRIQVIGSSVKAAKQLNVSESDL